MYRSAGSPRSRMLYLFSLAIGIQLSFSAAFAGSCRFRGLGNDNSPAQRIWRNNLTLGAILAQQRNDLSGAKLLLDFEVNTLLKKTDNYRLHTFFDVGLTRLPQQFRFSASRGSSVREENFIYSVKALQTGVGFYFARDFRYSDRDVLALGPVFRFDLGNVLNPAQTLLIQPEKISI